MGEKDGYWWMQGRREHKEHTSATWCVLALGHKWAETLKKRMGISEANQNWNPSIWQVGSAFVQYLNGTNLLINQLIYTSKKTSWTPPTTAQNNYGRGFVDTAASEKCLTTTAPHNKKKSTMKTIASQPYDTRLRFAKQVKLGIPSSQKRCKRQIYPRLGPQILSLHRKKVWRRMWVMVWQ